MSITIRTFVTTIVATVLVVSAATAAKADVHFLGKSKDQHAVDTAPATHASDSANDRLLIVNGQHGRVIYDDSKDDLFCAGRHRLQRVR